MTVPPMRIGRRIEGISAVLLPFTAADAPDWDGLAALLERTWAAGLTPAVNMDTGYVHLLPPDERTRVLTLTSEAARGRRFVAGAFIEGDDRRPAAAYAERVEQIRAAGGTPILFQCSALARAPEEEVARVYAEVGRAGGPLFAFE